MGEGILKTYSNGTCSNVEHFRLKFTKSIDHR